MYHFKLFYHVEIFRKKRFLVDVKAKFLISHDQNVGRGDRMADAQRRIERHGDSFAGPGGHSANLKARMSFFRGSWCLCSPSFLSVAEKLNKDNREI